MWMTTGEVPSARFNSRTREGCDLPTAATEVAREEFQFTHPRGVRLQGWGGGCGAASTDLLLRRYSNYPFYSVTRAPKSL